MNFDNEKIYIEDQRKTHFFMVDNDLVDIKKPFIRKLKGTPLLLLCVIYSKTNNTNYIPSFKQITKHTGIARQTLKKGLDKLEKLNLIKVVRRKGLKPRIIILPIPEQQNEKHLDETGILKFIENNYNDFSPKTKKEIYNFITNDGKLNDNMPDNLVERIKRDRHKLKLVGG